MAEAGWYADPADPAWVRWWDGVSWGAEAYPAAPAEPVLVAAGVPSLEPTAVGDPGPAATVAPSVVRASAPEPAPLLETEQYAVPTLEPVPLPDPGPAGVLPFAERQTVSEAPLVVPLLEPLPAASAPVVLAPGAPSQPAAASAEPVVADVAPQPAVSLAPSSPATTTAPPASAPPPTPAPATHSIPAHHPGEVDPDSFRSAATTFLPDTDSGGGLGSRPPAGGTAVDERMGGGFLATGLASAGAAAASSASTFSGVASYDVAPVVTASSGGRHGRLKALVALGVVLVLGAVLVAVGLPRWRDKQAADAAAAAPAVLAKAAPKTLVGQKAARGNAANPTATAASLTDRGASWAWGGVYGRADEVTYYVAGEVPTEQRAAAMLAQSDPQSLHRLLEEIGSAHTMAQPTAQDLSSVTRYVPPTGGTAWCMPVTVADSGGGYCLWTNGKELLEVLSAPSIPEYSAKFTLAALAQLAKAAAQTATGPAPKPSATKAAKA